MPDLWLCQKCFKEFECNGAYAGLRIKCPNCFMATELILTEKKTSGPMTIAQNTATEEEWMSDPVSDKQKAMLVLYGIDLQHGLTKGEASALM